LDWKNQFIKTPYLVLFIVLIAVGVGTASALITITLSGNVHVTGDTTMEGTLGVGTDTPDAAFHVVGGGSDFTPNKQGVQITGSDASNSPGIELTGDAEPPYIDFQNDITGTDFDGRIILSDDDTLSIIGADLECPNCIDPSDLSRFGSASFAITDGVGGTGCYIGEVRLFAGSRAPAGWLPAEGQTLLISQNAALFSLLGTTYGGDGTTIFNLPDLSDINPKSANDAGLNYVICTVGIFP